MKTGEIILIVVAGGAFLGTGIYIVTRRPPAAPAPQYVAPPPAPPPPAPVYVAPPQPVRQPAPASPLAGLDGLVRGVSDIFNTGKNLFGNLNNLFG